MQGAKRATTDRARQFRRRTLRQPQRARPLRRRTRPRPKRPQAAYHTPAPTVPAPPATAADAGAADGEGPGRKLLEILESLDLDDLPRHPRRLTLAPEHAIDRMARGDWIEFVSRDGASAHSKVAWINRRRTVALLVRRDDRRAMSLRTDELRERFARGRAFLLEG